MSHRLAAFVTAGLLFILQTGWAQQDHLDRAQRALVDPDDGCTIGVASARATKDGRPMVWKTRDASTKKNALYYSANSLYRFLAVIDAGSPESSWMSVNEKGFAIVNSVASDLVAGTTGLGNGTFMTRAAGTCATVADFQYLLDSTNVTQRQTEANFAVIDSTGAAAIFETGGKAYWKYDAASNPLGYVLRTNFAFNGGGTTGLNRFKRTTALFGEFSTGDSLLPRTILRYQMRDFADPSGIPYAVPYSGSVRPGVPSGYIPTDETICRFTSVSAAVIHGVKNGEAASSSTMWAILGQPATGIAVPYWPVGQPPDIARDFTTARLNDEATAIFSKLWNDPSFPSYVNTAGLRTGTGGGIWSILFPAENQLFAAADTLLASWRSGKLTPADVLSAESTYAAIALSALQTAKSTVTSIADGQTHAVPSTFHLLQNYPNPFNPSTVVRYSVPSPMGRDLVSTSGRDGQLPALSYITLKVYDVLGREIAELANGFKEAGEHTVPWNATVTSGIYLCRLEIIRQDGSGQMIRRMIKMTLVR